MAISKFLLFRNCISPSALGHLDLTVDTVNPQHKALFDSVPLGPVDGVLQVGQRIPVARHQLCGPVEVLNSLLLSKVLAYKSTFPNSQLGFKVYEATNLLP